MFRSAPAEQIPRVNASSLVQLIFVPLRRRSARGSRRPLLQAELHRSQQLQQLPTAFFLSYFPFWLIC